MGDTNQAGLRQTHNTNQFRKVLARQPFEMLDITIDHADAIKDLPFHHRDLFDRLLVAQAKVEGLTLVTHDLHLKKYRVAILEAC